ncbi:MAG: Dps family protein [Bacillaceae bacterium]
MSLEIVLNKQLANWNVLYTKLHKYHWYVKGPHFFTLHEKFELYYNDANLMVDELAERILTIGGQPLATLRQYLEAATIQEDTEQLTAEEMVASLLKDYTTIIEESRQVVALAEESGDEETADLFRDKIAALEKQNWMLNSYLG